MRKFSIVLGLLVAVSMLLAACGPKAEPTEAPAAERRLLRRPRHLLQNPPRLLLHRAPG